MNDYQFSLFSQSEYFQTRDSRLAASTMDLSTEPFLYLYLEGAS